MTGEGNNLQQGVVFRGDARDKLVANLMVEKLGLMGGDGSKYRVNANQLPNYTPPAYQNNICDSAFHRLKSIVILHEFRNLIENLLGPVAAAPLQIQAQEN